MANSPRRKAKVRRLTCYWPSFFAGYPKLTFFTRLLLVQKTIRFPEIALNKWFLFSELITHEVVLQDEKEMEV